jgi:hypothetical protein
VYFIRENKMVVDLDQNRFSFGFVSDKYFPLCKDKEVFLSSKIKSVPLDFRCGELTVVQKRDLETLINQYSDVLSDKLGRTHVLEYDIRVLDKTPVRSPPYRLSPPKMEYLRGHIDKLLKEGVIEPSCSHYSSPMFLVPKPDGEYRAVVDFRALNKHMP